MATATASRPSLSRGDGNSNIRNTDSLTCLPQSFSRNFRIRGTTGAEAGLTFNWFEQGTIDWNGAKYKVVKHGPYSGHWTLEGSDGVVIDARKEAFTRTFVLEGDSSGRMTLQAQELFTRDFELRQASDVVGTIRPMHMFTRQATIDCNGKVDELTQLFAFWLVVITWRRAANNSNNFF